MTSEPSLTPEERAGAAGMAVYIVWMRDWFGFGEDKASPLPVAVHLTRAAAKADAAERGDFHEAEKGTLLQAYEEELLTPAEVRRMLGGDSWSPRPRP